jgi:hypothetical protein
LGPVKDDGLSPIIIDVSVNGPQPTEEDIAFILKAVNNHDKLVKMVRALTTDIKTLMIPAEKQHTMYFRGHPILVNIETASELLAEMEK